MPKKTVNLSSTQCISQALDQSIAHKSEEEVDVSAQQSGPLHKRAIEQKKGLIALPLLLATLFALIGGFGLFAHATTFSPASPNLGGEAERPVVALPRVSLQAPVIDGSRIVWHDDRNGPTDIWGIDITGGEPYSITSQPGAEMHPDIFGNRVIYEDNRNGNWDLYTNIIGQPETTPVVVLPGYQRYPKISGDYVVYQDENPGFAQSDVYMVQLSTGEITPLAVVAGYQGRPNIDGDWVVWNDLRDPLVPQLGLYQISTKITSFHPAGCDYECRPQILNGQVVWHDGRNGNKDIYLLDIQTQAETPLVTSPGEQLYPVISDSLLTWQDQDTYGNWNLFGQPRVGGAIFPISLAPSAQIFPAVYANQVVWQDNRAHSWDLYSYTWNGTPPDLPSTQLLNPKGLEVGAFPGGQIRLSWQDTITNETGFVIQRSEGIFNANWQDYSTLPANTSNYTDIGTVGESYWYRVRAQGAAGNSTYTNESYTTAFDQVPNLDERYLLLLINETRMDPATWGYPSEVAVNPIQWNSNLAYAARAHALGMNNSACCQGHIDLIERGPSDRARASGYPFLAAENLFVGESGPTGMNGVHQGFMDSEGHRDAIMDGNAREGAIGFAPGGRGTVVELFSRGAPDLVVSALPTGIVIPYTATLDTPFVYQATFWNPSLLAPTSATVFIDNQPYPMTLKSGVPGRGTYQFSTTLSPGTHEYYFEFVWDNPQKIARLPETASFTGPTVREKKLYVDGSMSTSGDGYSPTTAFKQIEEALNVAQPGDTIQVAPGLYAEKLHIPANIRLSGAGWATTTLQGDGSGTVVTMGNGSEIDGFTIRNSGIAYWDAGIFVDPANSVAIHHNRIMDNAMGIAHVCFTCQLNPCQSESQISNNLVIGQSETGINVHCGLQAINNTVVGNKNGIYVIGPNALVKNNIVVGTQSFGINGEQSPTVAYNNVWQSGLLDYVDVIPGEGSLSHEPNLVDPEGGDFRLSSDSICVDAGDPSAIYNDPDGSRNDLGAFGGPASSAGAVPVPNPSATATPPADTTPGTTPGTTATPIPVPTLATLVVTPTDDGTSLTAIPTPMTPATVAPATPTLSIGTYIPETPFPVTPVTVTTVTVTTMPGSATPGMPDPIATDGPSTPVGGATPHPIGTPEPNETVTPTLMPSTDATAEPIPTEPTGSNDAKKIYLPSVFQ